jgi:hypothetical protein
VVATAFESRPEVVATFLDVLCGLTRAVRVFRGLIHVVEVVAVIAAEHAKCTTITQVLLPIVAESDSCRQSELIKAVVTHGTERDPLSDAQSKGLQDAVAALKVAMQLICSDDPTETLHWNIMQMFVCLVVNAVQKCRDLVGHPEHPHVCSLMVSHDPATNNEM